MGLLVVFAAYGVVYAQGLPVSKLSTVTIGDYALQGTYNLVATVQPNELYNSTNLSPGQGTLFAAITRTINVTYACTISLGQTGDVNLGASYLVSLSGGVWNKTLSQSTQSEQQSGVGSVMLTRSFQFNVSQTMALAKRIGTELQYTSPSYMIQISPVITGSLGVVGRTVPVDFVTPMNLTFSGGLITPTGTSYSYVGNITSPEILTYGSTNTYRYVSYGALAASLLLLGISLYYVLMVEKGNEPGEADVISALTQPYREVIASTNSLPSGTSQVSMEKWEDLVKVADTIGRPILEYVDRGEGFTHHVFWVLDGYTTYVYEATLRPK